jgi:L-iditol 2-dehydrogenase
MGHGSVRGGFAEKGVAIPSNLRLIPDNVSYEEACFTEPLACCLNGSRNTHIEPGHDAVVVGAGPIGLLHVQLAKYQGARVIACDLIPQRLEKAREMGADEVIQVDQVDAISSVMEMTGGRGADAIVVAVGSVKAAEMAIKMAGISAYVNLFAGFYPPGKLDLDPNIIHYKQINLTGSHDFTPHDFTTALKLIQTGVVKVEPLISHRLPLDEISSGFEAVIEKDGLKVVIEIS